MRTEVLDHGYVELIETWGSDERIIESARMSTGKGFLGWGTTHATDTGHESDCQNAANKIGLVPCYYCGAHAGDEKLLRYLWTSDPPHTSPFELAGAVFEIQAPIFVFREWHRHRTQSYNEMSARYTPLPDVNYVPTIERLMMNSKTNKQAGVVAGASELTDEGAQRFQNYVRMMYEEQERGYQAALRSGVPKELARVHLPVGRYSRMRAQAVLLNWMKFMTLRCAPNAQWEIRQFADVVRDTLSEKFPRTMALFDEKEGR